MVAKKKLFIIDAMAMAYRTFFAIGASRLTSSNGEPVGAVFGSALFLNKLLQDEKPDYLCAVTDTPAKTFRHEIYADYKANRDSMPQELSGQLGNFFKIFEKMGIPVLRKDGYEADDVIGSLIKKMTSKNIDIFIVSGDKDFYQLVTERVFLYAPKKNDVVEIINIEGVFEKFKCKPNQVIDCLALIGDKADNVPGVPGIGDKGAADLISKFGSLDGVFENIDSITAKRQKTGLLENRELAFLSKKLVTIDCDVSLDVESLDELKIDASFASSNSDLLDFYEGLSFKSLVQKLRGKVVSSSSQEKPKVKTEQLKISSQNLDKFGDWIAGLPAESHVSMSFIWDGEYSFSKELKQVSYVDKHIKIIDCPEDEDDKEIFLSYLKALLADSRICKISHGWKKIIQSLQKYTCETFTNIYDLKIADYILNPNDNRHEILNLFERYHLESTSEQDYVGNFEALYNLQINKLSEFNLSHILEDIEFPLIKVLAQMESTGIKVDTAFLLKYSRQLGKRVTELEKNIYKIVGREFNINSTNQIREIVFEELKIHEELGLKRIKKTKTGYSTDESVLNLMIQHPFPKALLEYRQLTKLKNTWIDTLPEHINPQTERVHTNYQQTVAATGRLSSINPNLQNIPMRTEIGRNIRKAFIASKGYKLISADYSQVEIRILAGMANEEHLIAAFRNGEDIHTATAAKIFNVKAQEVDMELRSRAKAVNFGIMYGMGPQRLAQDIGVNINEAKDFIARYLETYSGIRKFTEGLIEKGKSLGFSTTLTGRRRQIPGIADRNRAVAARAENIAVNAPIQGSAADIIKLAMIRIHKKFISEKLDARLILQVHDELVVECHEDILERVKAILVDGMEHAIEFPVPLKVEVGVGNNWFEAH